MVRRRDPGCLVRSGGWTLNRGKGPVPVGGTCLSGELPVPQKSPRYRDGDGRAHQSPYQFCGCLGDLGLMLTGAQPSGDLPDQHAICPLLQWDSTSSLLLQN